MAFDIQFKLIYQGIRDVFRVRSLSILVYFLGDSPFQIMYAWSLYHKINDSLKTDKYDAIISISYPFYVNVATACAIKENLENCGVTIADCGDPFFYNPAIKRPIYFKWLEKFTLQKFDFISLPIKEAIPAYKSHNVEEKIRIIPQGFEITDIDEKKYIKNRVPTFCFAGMFYENIRNPQFFLDFLLSLKDDFKFIRKLQVEIEHLSNQEILSIA